MKQIPGHCCHCADYIAGIVPSQQSYKEFKKESFGAYSYHGTENHGAWRHCFHNGADQSGTPEKAFFSPGVTDGDQDYDTNSCQDITAEWNPEIMKEAAQDNF